MTTRKKRREYAWAPPQYDIADVTALQALAKGQASESQQKRALAWIVQAGSQVNELSYRSGEDGGERETAFAEGRRFVGMQVFKLVNLPASVVAKLRDQKG